jgi:iron uptake system component EfeO
VIREFPVAAGLAVALLAAACGSAGENPVKPARGVITVKASDTECTVSRTTADAGVIEFAVANTGTKVTEFYVYAEGDRVVGEVENITPGLNRTFHVQIADPGTYETACKPGMAGKGIRGAFTVTGSRAAPESHDAKLQTASASYKRWVNSQADALLTETTAFVGLVKAGKVAEAKDKYPLARSYWERIEPVAESFGDLDPKIDGRADVVAEGLEFTGYHRLEKDLWVDGLQPDSSAIAARLLADVKTIVANAKTVELNPLQLANGSKELLDEMATGKITGEEERYSHTDLYDFAANFEGSKAAVAALRPALEERDAALVAELDARTKALDALIESHARGDGYSLYTDLSKDDLRALTDALDAVSAQVSRVAGVVAGT